MKKDSWIHLRIDKVIANILRKRKPGEKSGWIRQAIIEKDKREGD